MMAMDVLDKLRDLQKQATTERSHHYVAQTVTAAIAEITQLRAKVALAQIQRGKVADALNKAARLLIE